MTTRKSQLCRNDQKKLKLINHEKIIQNFNKNSVQQYQPYLEFKRIEMLPEKVLQNIAENSIGVDGEEGASIVEPDMECKMRDLEKLNKNVEYMDTINFAPIVSQRRKYITIAINPDYFIK